MALGGIKPGRERMCMSVCAHLLAGCNFESLCILSWVLQVGVKTLHYHHWKDPPLSHLKSPSLINPSLPSSVSLVPAVVLTSLHWWSLSVCLSLWPSFDTTHTHTPASVCQCTGCHFHFHIGPLTHCWTPSTFPRHHLCFHPSLLSSHPFIPMFFKQVRRAILLPTCVE